MNKNTVGFGVILALVVPVIGLLIWLLVNLILASYNVLDKNGDVFQLSLKTAVLVAVCCNLIPFHFSKDKRWDNMLRGIGLVTISMMFAWAFYFDVIQL
ncbi:MAG: hypothetical protein ACI94Y_000263 [Maribacter sp.]|jgi:hypothetical protein